MRGCARSTSVRRSTSPTRAPCGGPRRRPGGDGPAQVSGARARAIADTVAELCRVVASLIGGADPMNSTTLRSRRLAGRHDRTAQVRRAGRRLLRVFGAPHRAGGRHRPGHRRRRLRADRGHLQPGRPVRRLHRHASRRVPRPGPRHRRRAAASPATGSCSAATTSARTAGSANPPTSRWSNADALVAAYVAAGYTKIHLDCSMRCADDPAVLADDVVAARSARLLRVAEDAARSAGSDGPVYVIGTEVPVPGGAHETLDRLTPTPADRPASTHRRAPHGVRRRGPRDVWPRVMALVVQPGVEFDHLHVIDYEHARHRRTAPRPRRRGHTWSSRRTPPTTSGRRSCASSSRTTGPSSRSARG